MKLVYTTITSGEVETVEMAETLKIAEEACHEAMKLASSFLTKSAKGCPFM